MKQAALLGVNELSLESFREKIEAVLDLKLVPHESSYHGGSYFRCNFDNANLIIQDNFVEDDGETTEAEFPLSKVLFYLSGEAAVVDSLVTKLTKESRLAVTLRSNIY